LIQVLSDGTTTYTYGLGRISQQSGNASEYFLGDALGSVRQMTDQAGAVTYAAAYDPYGVVTHSGGASNTEYGFAGEATSGDSTQLLYLRARYYNPADGRFLTKDPSRLENNLYLYTRANPINRVDPSGLFSKDQIAKSLGLSSFEAVLSEASVYENWGFIGALLTAEPGDMLAGGKLGMGVFGYRTDIVYKPFVRVDIDGNCNITFNGIPINLRLQLLSVVSHFGNIYEVDGRNSTWWRDDITRYYKIQKNNKTIVYADGSDKVDYPDFYGGLIGGSVFQVAGIELSLFVDRFGGMYFTPTGTTSCLPNVGCIPGLPVALSRFEGYVGWSIESEDELRRALSGFNPGCGSATIALVVGFSAGGCVGASGISIYSIGLLAGINVSWMPYTFYIGKNPLYSWEWAVQDRLDGIRREDLITAN
jgi:RHS repeat-associated protein